MAEQDSQTQDIQNAANTVQNVGGAAQNTRSFFSNLKTIIQFSKSAKAAQTAATTAQTAATTARTAATTARIAGTAARGALAASEASTGPIGLMILAAQFGQGLKKYTDKIRKAIAKVVGGFILYLILKLGLKILGAIAGFVFGTVTGLPLLLLGPIGLPLYAGWVIGWTVYGWFKPTNMFAIAAHPVSFIQGFWAGIKGAFAAVGSFFSSIGSGITQAAASTWGGIVSAGGAVFNAVGNVGGALLGGLSGTGASSTIAGVSVGTAFAAIGIGGTLVGITTSASFFNPDPEEAQFLTGDNEFYTISKTASPFNLENEDLASPQTITFTITLEAKEQNLNNITIGDNLTVSGENVNNSIPRDKDGNPVSPPCGSITGNHLDAGATWTCRFEIQTQNTWTDSLVTNIVRVQATPEGETQPTIDSATAIVRIGDPPTNCPQGWPTTGDLSQGPQGSTSHGDINSLGYPPMEAVDIATPLQTPVYATVDGIVTSIDDGTGRTNNGLNQVINVAVSGCPGLILVSFIHLASVGVNEADQITFGQPIATTGDPGAAQHLHYQFNPDNNRTVQLGPPFVPDSFPRDCNGISECNLHIESAPF